MPDDIAIAEPDWNTVRESYLQGQPMHEIAERFGLTVNAIRCRAHRAGWKALQVQALAVARQEISDEIRSCLLSSVLKDARRWPAVEPGLTDSDSYERQVRNRERLVSTASKLLGWELDATAAGTAAATWDTKVIELVPVKQPQLANE